MAGYLRRNISVSICGARHCMSAASSSVCNETQMGQLKISLTVCADGIMPLHSRANQTKRCFHDKNGHPKLFVTSLFPSACKPPVFPSLLFTVQPIFSSTYQLTRCLSTKSGPTEEVMFKNSDICLVFDKADALIVQTTFAEAKSVASKHRSRLVYMHKNADGILCFKLQELGNSPSAGPAPKYSARGESNAKQKRNSAKVFKIKSAIGDHDLNIKMEKIKSVLEKGKPAKIIIATAQSKGAKEQKSAASLTKKFSEDLQDVCKVHQDYNNEAAVQLSLTPIESNPTKTT